jgi:hypothetical protein
MSIYRGKFTQLEKYDFGLVAVKEVRRNKYGSQHADDYTFLYRNGNVNHHVGTGFLYLRKTAQQLGGYNLLGQDVVYDTKRSV